MGAILLNSGCSERKRSSLSRDPDAAAVVVVDASGPVVGAGVVTAEVEPNDDSENGTAVELPGTARGVLASQEDVDVYVVEPGEGWLSARLTGLDRVDVMLELKSAEGKLLARSDRGPANVSEGIPNYGVSAGEKYVLVVREFVPKKSKGEPRTTPSAPYELRLALTAREEPAVDAAPSEEQEPNATAEEAVAVPLGRDVYGYIGWTGDVDFWRLDPAGISEGQVVDVTVLGVEGLAVEMTVLDASGAAMMERRGERGRPLFVPGLVPALTEGGPPASFGLRLSGKRANPETLYVVRAEARAIDIDEEREPNDDGGRATPLALGDERSGVKRGFITAGDVDIFQLSGPPSASVVEFELTPPADADVLLEVRVGETTVKSIGGGWGSPEIVRGVPVPPGKTVRARVTGKYRGETARPYDLRWSLKEGEAPSPGADPAPTP